MSGDGTRLIDPDVFDQLQAKIDDDQKIRDVRHLLSWM